MQKLMIALFISFLVFGIVLNAPLVISDEHESNNSGTTIEVEVEVDVDDDRENESDEDKDEGRTNEAKDADNEEGERKDRRNIYGDRRDEVTEAREVFMDKGCVIKLQKATAVVDGKRVAVLKKKIECRDGRKAEIRIKIENSTTGDGKIEKRFRYEFGNETKEVKAEDDISLEEETNGTEYKLRARLKNGNSTDIKIMPDTASEVALERLRAKGYTVELRERKHDNVPRVVYNIQTNKQGKFLGVFKLGVKVNGEVDPETGELLGTGKPWWAFLVTGEDSDQTEVGEEQVDVNATADGRVLANSTDAETTNNPTA